MHWPTAEARLEGAALARVGDGAFRQEPLGECFHQRGAASLRLGDHRVRQDAGDDDVSLFGVVRLPGSPVFERKRVAAPEPDVGLDRFRGMALHVRPLRHFGQFFQHLGHCPIGWLLVGD